MSCVEGHVRKWYSAIQRDLVDAELTYPRGFPRHKINKKSYDSSEGSLLVGIGDRNNRDYALQALSSQT